MRAMEATKAMATMEIPARLRCRISSAMRQPLSRLTTSRMDQTTPSMETPSRSNTSRSWRLGEIYLCTSKGELRYPYLLRISTNMIIDKNFWTCTIRLRYSSSLEKQVLVKRHKSLNSSYLTTFLSKTENLLHVPNPVELLPCRSHSESQMKWMSN